MQSQNAQYCIIFLFHEIKYMNIFVSSFSFRILYFLVVLFLFVTYITSSTSTSNCFEYSAIKNYSLLILASSSMAIIPSRLANGLERSNRFWCLQNLSLWLIKKPANMYYHHSQCLERRKDCCSLKGEFLCVYRFYIYIYKISYLSLFFHC